MQPVASFAMDVSEDALAAAVELHAGFADLLVHAGQKRFDLRLQFVPRVVLSPDRSVLAVHQVSQRGLGLVLHEPAEGQLVLGTKFV